MIERFDVIGSTDFEDRVDGPYVTHDDHVAEMREVLQLLNVFASGKVTAKTWGEYGEIAKKYAHYLDEK